MMLTAADAGEAALACDIAALLEERDPVRAADAPADIGLRLAALREHDPAADRGAIARIRQAAGQYRRRLRLSADTRPRGEPARLVAAAFPDRVAQSRGEPGAFRLAGGGGARLSSADPLAREKFLAVASLELRAAPRIRMAAALDPANLPAQLAAQIVEATEASFDPVSGSVLTRRRRRLGALVLSDRTEAADPATAAELLARAVPLDKLDWSDAARQLRARVALMRGLEGDAWPDWSDAALDAERGWLAPYLTGARSLAEAARVDLHAALRARLTYEQGRRLDAELPAQLPLPGGPARVDYTQPVPAAEARAQLFYGLDETPRLAGGRIGLRLALLSPAGRPIAVTADLATFWRGGWADARRDMRGRYPKHDWPENPASAPPGRRRAR
jgi:ATP-dependent helicase HrpB